MYGKLLVPLSEIGVLDEIRDMFTLLDYEVKWTKSSKGKKLSGEVECFGESDHFDKEFADHDIMRMNDNKIEFWTSKRHYK